MDQLRRRTRMAERQVARRLKAAKDLRYRAGLMVDRQRSRNFVILEIQEQRREAVRVRREDWELGPLAPRRDVPRLERSSGKNSLDVRGRFITKEAIPWGSISPNRAMLQWKPSEAEKSKVAAWAGGMKNLCLAVGDRVAVQEGPCKGQIGQISKIEWKVAGVVLKEIGMANVAEPPNVRPGDGRDRVVSMNTVLPISAVRLVHPMTHDGVTRDVVIRELRAQRVRHDAVTGRAAFERVVPGPRLVIPWPYVPARTREDYVGDTPRIDVEDRTFMPTLAQPPMPASVLDELRNRYSKFRTRHEDEYVARRQAEEDEKDARRRSATRMRTPLQDFHLREREARRARGQPVLTEDMLSKVGEVMMRARAGAKDEASVVGDLQKAVEQLSLQTPPL